MAPSSDNVLSVNPRDPGIDRRMISTPDLWPLGAILPLVRSDSHPRYVGVLVARAEIPRFRVFTVSMYDRRVVALMRGARVECESIPHVDYADIDALLADGWRVT